ncbi:hypothetical protein ABE425_14850 [Chryseobacterium cucumeris]|uniref:hypothetical protein n=1 Tax=Chryseobacterium cucumeris TaxID=1813611 RepID=UPI00320A6C4E
MKKVLQTTFLCCILFSKSLFSQFTISDTSSDWKMIGKEVSDTSILTNGAKGKLKMIDFRSKTMGYDPLSTFKSQGQKNIDNLNREIRKGNEGVKGGYFNFIFNIEPDTLDKLYGLIIDHFETKKKEEITLSFPEGNIYLDFNSKTLFYAVSFGIDQNGQKIFTAPMIKSQVNKLFGKK